MTHTYSGEYYPWWYLNLGSAHRISKLVIANRNDECSACAANLSNDTISLHDTGGTIKVYR
jgi:hypothetical protein